ncbi:MAG: hypothetical protein J6E46_08935 [Faecalicoccus sp.]|nr:hypothetical protein [Faecalicoccus sp.]
MHFNKKFFREHYGKKYFRIMYWSLGFCLLFLQLAYYPQFFGWNINLNIVGFLAFISMMLLLVAVPVSGYLYYDRMRMAKSVQVWFDKGKLYTRKETRPLFASKKNRIHTITDFVKRPENLDVQDEYLVISGLIKEEDVTDMQTVHREIYELKIPRCFDNEQRIIDYFNKPKSKRR